MLKYFRINDPYRLLAVSIFILVTRLGIILLSNPFSILQDEWFLTGQQLLNGNSGSVTGYGPLFTLFYQVFFFLFGPSYIAATIVSGLLIFVQAMLINYILLRVGVFNENTYLPAACYTLLLSVSPEFSTLSPHLIAVTFILVVIRNLFAHLQFKRSDEIVFSTGFFSGVAALIHPPAIVLILMVYITYWSLSTTLHRRYFLLGYSFIFPFILVWLFYFWNNEGILFWINYSASIFPMEIHSLVPVGQLALLIGFPSLIMLFDLFRNLSAGFTSSQQVLRRAMRIIFLFGLLTAVLERSVSANNLIYLCPTLAFFMTHRLLEIKRKRLAELLFVLLLASSLVFLFNPLVETGFTIVDYNSLRIE